MGTRNRNTGKILPVLTHFGLNVHLSLPSGQVIPGPPRLRLILVFLLLADAGVPVVPRLLLTAGVPIVPRLPAQLEEHEPGNLFALL
jgi:hypothetical protein